MEYLLIFLGIWVLCFGMAYLGAALDDGWSPLDAWVSYKEKKLDLKERETDLEIKRLKVAYHKGYIEERARQKFEEDFDETR